MANFDINKYDEKKNYVIEASAGTGKTFNIKGIVNKLVKEKNVDLNKILIVTYTEKAAGELKNRIREELNGKGNQYDMDKASIGTIHSFCQGVINEFGISANLPSGLKTIEENELKNFIARFIREGNLLTEIAAIKNVDPNFKIEKIEIKYDEAIAMYYLDSKFNEDKSIISLYDSNSINVDVKNYYLKSSMGAISSIGEAKRELNDFAKYYDCLNNSFQTKAKKMIDGIKESIGQKIVFSGVTAKGIKKWNDEEKEAFNYFDSLRSDDVVTLILNESLRKLYKAWQNEKAINRMQSFDDMIRNVREAIINNEDLKNKLKGKYTYAIIDEFQDTNQKQFDIFKAIFMEDDNHHIIVVGDPKQSIYSFQGADIDVYKNAVDIIVGKGGEKCILGNNYRSTENMVLTCNEVFKKYGFTEPEFQSVEPKTKVTSKDIPTVEYDGKPIEAYWLAVKGQNEDKVEAIDSKTNLFSRIAAEQILDCCKSDKTGKTKLQLLNDGVARNVSFRDFTVLARTSSEMKEIQHELKLSGIPFIRYKDSSLYKGRECAHWIALLQAINTPDFIGRNRLAFKKALFTGFFGKTLQQISDSKYDKDDSIEIRKLNEWKQLATSRNWEGLIDDILLESDLRYTMKSLKEIQSYSIYRQIGEFCVDYLSNKQSIDSLIRKLKELSVGVVGIDGSDGGIVEKGTNFDCVQIMTIHASKGLEFPVVIAPCGFKGLMTPDVYKYKNANKESVLSFEKLDESEYLRPEIDELKDIFYVAYTRAKYVMILPYYEKYGGNKEKNFQFLKDSLDNMIDNHRSMLRIITLSNNYSIDNNRKLVKEILNRNNTIKTVSDEERLHQQELLKKLAKNKSGVAYKHSYSSLSHGCHDNELEEDDEQRDLEGKQAMGLADFDKKGVVVNCKYDDSLEPMDWPDGFPKGAAIGTALHEIFEKLDYVTQNDLEKIIQKSFSNAAIAFQDEWLEPVKEMVDRVLHANLPVVRGSKTTGSFLQLCEISDKLAECEFIFNRDEEFLKNYFNGFIDLIFKNGDYYAIVDWKSDSLNDDFVSYSNADELKKHVDSSYSIQRTLYAYCLIRWLKSFNPSMSEQEVFEMHFGGVYYVFMRGCNNNTSNGIYCHSWNKWDDIETSFKEIVKERIGW